MVFYHNLLYWISLMLGQGGARLAKNMQEHVFIDVPRPGNMLAVRGGYTRMRPCRQCHGNGSHESQTPPPPTKGCRQPGPKKVKNSVNFFSHSKVFLPAVPAMFFFTKIFRTFFHCVARGFLHVFFHDFFAHFSHYFSHGFSRRIFRTSLLRIFLTHFFIAVCCPKGFHSLQSQHCVTVPETGQTTTCRSSPSILTQYSHKQVENFESFWKDKRQIFTLQTIRHKHFQSGMHISCENESFTPGLKFSTVWNENFTRSLENSFFQSLGWESRPPPPPATCSGTSSLFPTPKPNKIKKIRNVHRVTHTSPPGTWAIFSTFWGACVVKMHRRPGETEKNPLEEKIRKLKQKRSTVETAPRNCRFLSLVVVEPVLKQKSYVSPDCGALSQQPMPDAPLMRRVLPSSLLALGPSIHWRTIRKRELSGADDTPPLPVALQARGCCSYTPAKGLCCAPCRTPL